MEKKLYKVRDKKMISGVCSGMAEYFGFDVTLVRLVWALLTIFFFGTGVIVYIVCAIVIPEAPEYIDSDAKEK